MVQAAQDIQHSQETADHAAETCWYVPGWPGHGGSAGRHDSGTVSGSRENCKPVAVRLAQAVHIVRVSTGAASKILYGRPE